MAMAQRGSQCSEDFSREIVGDPLRQYLADESIYHVVGHPDSGDGLTIAVATNRASLPTGGSALRVGGIKLDSTSLAAPGSGCAVRRHSAVGFDTKAPVHYRGSVHSAITRGEQGPEDRGLEVRTWRTYLGA